MRVRFRVAAGKIEVIDRDKPVRVFRNLKHGCYSILQNGRLKASARQVLASEMSSFGCVNRVVSECSRKTVAMCTPSR